MSTGLACMFFCADQKWYYLLQNSDCPVGAWDWREYATCYGAFETQDQVEGHLRMNHANPGGCVVDPNIEVDSVIASHIESARR